MTVTVERATDSDALSTALFVLGPDAARALLGVEAVRTGNRIDFAARG